MEKKQINVNYLSVKWDELTEEQQRVVTEAQKMVNRSYSPYSHFRVGAAVLLANGEIVRGSNQENAAYPSGLCAERTALFAANANYPDQAVKILAIACFTNGNYTALPGTPCGNCRQVMIETEHRFGNKMQVIMYGADDIYIFDSADALVPLGFFSEDLKG